MRLRCAPPKRIWQRPREGSGTAIRSTCFPAADGNSRCWGTSGSAFSLIRPRSCSWCRPPSMKGPPKSGVCGQRWSRNSGDATFLLLLWERGEKSLPLDLCEGLLLGTSGHQVGLLSAADFMSTRPGSDSEKCTKVLLDHSVRAQQRWQHYNAEGLGGLEVQPGSYLAGREIGCKCPMILSYVRLPLRVSA